MGRLLAFYEANAEAFTSPEQVRVSMILLKVEPWSESEVWDRRRREADEVYGQLEQGADFDFLQGPVEIIEDRQQGTDNLLPGRLKEFHALAGGPLFIILEFCKQAQKLILFGGKFLPKPIGLGYFRSGVCSSLLLLSSGSFCPCLLLRFILFFCAHRRLIPQFNSIHGGKSTAIPPKMSKCH